MHRIREPKKETFDADDKDFDDEGGLDALEATFPQLKKHVEQAKPIITPIINEVLPPGIIDIHQEVGSLITKEQAYPRIHHHFREDDMGYRALRIDMCKLRVRSRRYPWFGAFTGVLTFRENIAPIPGAVSIYHRYDIDGYLRYRPSVLLAGIVGFVFLLLLIATRPGWVPSLFFLAFGVGVTVIATYQLGRNERDEVAERVEESFMRLRATIHNRR